MPNILIADDEKEIVKLLKIYLEADGFSVVEAYDGESAWEILKGKHIDLAIVDIMMPKMDGYQVIRKVRQGLEIPVLVISAKTSLSDRILGLDLGADDYISKPFEPLEVAAKVRAHLRRAAPQKQTPRVLTAGKLALDLDTCMVTVDGAAMELTKTEFKVLEMFLEQPKRVFTKEQIYERAWFGEAGVDDNTIRVIISRLRDKIGARRITTIRGLGYRLENYE